MAHFTTGTTRRGLLGLGAAALPFAGGQAQDAYPSRPIQIVVPYAPGGAADMIARFISEKWRQKHGRPVVLDYRTGASGTIAANYVANMPPDGYTLLLGLGGPLTISPHVLRNVPYDSLRAFDPITLIAAIPNILATHPALPARTIPELVALAKSRPGQLTFGSAGIGTSTHLATELFVQTTGINAVHVPFRGGTPALNELMAGRVDFLIENLPQLLPQAQGGTIRALAVTGATRAPDLPEVPTVAESGLPGYEAAIWYGLLGPRGLPPEVRSRIHEDVTAILLSEEGRSQTAFRGARLEANTPEQFAEFMRQDSERWAQVVRAANIRLE